MFEQIYFHWMIKSLFDMGTSLIESKLSFTRDKNFWLWQGMI